jgi:hypothetical protein
MIKLQVVFHDGTVAETDVVSYDAAELTVKLNDETITSVAIGDIIAHRGSVARIVKL